MKRLTVCALGLLLVSSFSAQAEPIIDVGRVELLYGMADQDVPFFVTGGEPVNQLIFYIQVGDGGPELRNWVGEITNGPGTPGPHITAIDLVTGTIFEHNHLAAMDEMLVPQLRTAEITARSGTVRAGHPNGSPTEPWLLATVTFDTSMFGPESIGAEWELRLKQVVDTGDGGLSTNFGGDFGDSTVGSIVIVVPEPSTIALLTFGGAVILLGVSIRRQTR